MDHEIAPDAVERLDERNAGMGSLERSIRDSLGPVK
jgi:hypothetical protein